MNIIRIIELILTSFKFIHNLHIKINKDKFAYIGV